LDILFNGSPDIISVPVSYNKWNVKTYQVVYEGLFKQLEEEHEQNADKNDFESFRSLKTCPVCNGARLKKEALHFKIDDKNIAELAEMDISLLKEWFEGLETRLTERQNIIATEVLKEI